MKVWLWLHKYSVRGLNIVSIDFDIRFNGNRICNHIDFIVVEENGKPRLMYRDARDKDLAEFLWREYGIMVPILIEKFLFDEVTRNK